MSFDSDETKIRTIIDAVPKPEIIAEVRFRLSEDWAGDPAVKGLMLVRDGKDNDANFNLARPYRDAVEQAIRDARIGYYPFLNLALESEVRELDAEMERDEEKRRRKTRKVPVAV